MRHRLADSSLTARLVLGMVVLIIVTTLSAGVPAFLLTRSQLEAQARQQVAATQRSTASLYSAAQNRLDDLTQLLSERPTLRRLILDGDSVELTAYLDAFQAQGELDILQLCTDSDVIVGTNSIAVTCPETPVTGAMLLDGRPVLLSAYPIFDPTATGALGMAVTGIRLDGSFLTQMSDDTGVEQSILDDAGQALATTLPEDISGGSPAYFRETLPLRAAAGQPALTAEVALPVGELQQTERNALLILVASTGMVALLSVLLGTWYIRRQTAPLDNLTHAADLISQGDLTAPIPEPAGPREIATLSRALTGSQATMLQALDERSQARDWLNNLIQSINEGVVTFDTRGHITFMSQGAEIMTGWRSQDAIGRSINDVFALADPGDESFLDRIPPSGDKREIEILSRSGKILVVATTGARLIPPNSDTVQVALVLRDVTEEQALRNLRSFFLANISHEFRTPLSTLNASMELLMEELDDLSAAEIRELLRPSYLSLISLQTLIDNLLESSSIEAGSFAIRSRPVDLNEVITQALSIIRPQVDRRRQTIVVTEPPQLPYIEADRTRLTQALVNLLANASKYSPGGTAIDLTVTVGEDEVDILVADRGPGISHDDQARLFRRFVRLQDGESEQYGIGLGLYLVKKIAEAHGGSVSVENRPDGGAVFRLRLPAPVREKVA
ncbi:MAG: ATP-binding protein [Chloroflexota bacterium]